MANIRIKTRFGELSIDPAQIITFPKGIPGFENCTRWKLFHEIDDHGNLLNGKVVYLLSMDDGDVSLPLTDPTLSGFNYNLTLTDEEVAEIKLDDPSDILVLTVLSVKNDTPQNELKRVAGNMYVNIAAPILINTKSRIGMQKILSGNGS
ncbi:MAG: flagellar assembly protein FliW [Nitrosomonadales bacterium]|nr:flagellar assembly protein FliW [Nitrosomonadales bacterium]